MWISITSPVKWRKTGNGYPVYNLRISRGLRPGYTQIFFLIVSTLLANSSLFFNYDKEEFARIKASAAKIQSK